MLTSRGWWLLAVLSAVLTVALATGAGVLSFLGLTLLAWFLGNWVMFAVKVRWLEAGLSVERRLRDERGDIDTLWARQKAEVRVTLHCERPGSLAHVALLDRVPVLAKRLDGEPFVEGPLSSGEPLILSYRIECPAPGRLRFDGLKVRCTDLQGFFLVHLFVRDKTVKRVLPAMADARGHVPAKKRHNLIPLMGSHAHRRPGSGSDLLDLRDYMPGDPPKMIAWKASARRDRLMTKELESEVPIRCTLFIDISNSVRIGPVGKNALARVLEIAAAVTQANARARDLTGLALVDDTALSKQIRPGRGTRHLLRLMRALADAGDLFPHTDAIPLQRLIPLAYGAIQDIYPDALANDLNRFPIWLPMWSPQPAYTIPGPPRKPWPRWLRPIEWLWRRFRESPLAVHRWRLARWIPYQHRLYRWRKCVAAFISVRYGLDPGGLAQLLEDDNLCRLFLQRFLAEHQITCPQPMYDAQGRYLFQSPAKLDVLAEALSGSVRRGQDNELFVLLIDFLEAGPHLGKALAAARVALSKHHQVMVICPWPAGVPMPPAPSKRQQLAAPPVKPSDSAMPTVQELLNRASTSRVQQAFGRVNKAFARLGVAVLCAPDEQAVSLILHRMQKLRVQQRGVR